MSPAHAIGLIAPLLISGTDRNYGHGGWNSFPVRRYEKQRYEGAANKGACKKRRARNKSARKSRQRNRKP